MVCLQDESSNPVHCARFTASVQKIVHLKINLFPKKKKKTPEYSQGVLLKVAKDA